MILRFWFNWTQIVAILTLVACSSGPSVKDTQTGENPAPIIENSEGRTVDATDEPTDTRSTDFTINRALIDTFKLKSASHLTPSDWKTLPDWHIDELSAGATTLLQSCVVLKKYLEWAEVCAQAQFLSDASSDENRQFYETYFTPYTVNNEDGSSAGMVTGYYEPLLHGSLQPSAEYPYPVFGIPSDLMSIDVNQHPEAKTFRGVGRLVEEHFTPYFTREEIDRGLARLEGSEILWVKDKIELFFLQIQGSGRIQLENGETLRLGFGKTNGHPYRSIGKSLVEKGELKLSEASMQGIKRWGQDNPDRIDALLHENPSYVFFRRLPSNLNGPIGSLGVPLTPNRSIAVDNSFIPYGFPVFLSTTWPNTTNPLNRLMFAQDKGGAIKGAVRADYFWGFGESAATNAGKMKQRGLMWVLIPKGYSTNHSTNATTNN
ncbi:MAG: transglycosylase [Betaproteobacteria bacterium]|nr:transglycosylase [Betaproteobacteria bacterium]